MSWHSTLRPHKKILVATDGSKSASRAVKNAVKLLRKLSSTRHK
ncbi:MAG: universal stress protein [Comamonadaceae bacterium]|nr:universal stress protein [Comamonadaceae bacterium]